MAQYLSLTDRLKIALGNARSDSTIDRVHALLWRTAQATLTIEQRVFYEEMLRHDSLDPNNLSDEPSRDEIANGRDLSNYLQNNVAPLFPERGVRGYGRRYEAKKGDEFRMLMSYLKKDGRKELQD